MTETLEQRQAATAGTADSAPAGVLGTGMWTGTGRGATFTWVHTPENGRTRGLVVLAPPVGREAVQGYRALRQLAMLLAGAGYCVARVSYRGTGDSHELQPQDDVLRVWERNILDATAQARRVCGVEQLPVYGIGYRVGGGLLARVAERFDRVIAWEPVSGRTFVNQWSRLRRATLPEIPVTDGVDLMGLWLTDEQARELSSLPDPRTMGARPENLEVHREKDQPRAKIMYGVDSLDMRVHYDVLEDLLRQLPREELVPLTGTGRGPRRNEFRAADGTACAEEIVAVTPRGYPGILTGPLTGEGSLTDGGRAAHDGAHAAIAPRPGMPTTFFAPGASEPRDGSALWSETARRLAGLGVASLRADRDGAGDRALLWSDRDPNPYRDLNAEALREQAAWLAERFDADVVSTVLCSGAWAALRAAREPAGLPVKGMVLVSQNEWRMNQAFFDQQRTAYDGDAKLRAKANATTSATVGATAERAASTSARSARPAGGAADGSGAGNNAVANGMVANGVGGDDGARPGAACRLATTGRAAARRALAGATSWGRELLTKGKRAGSRALRRHAPESVWNLMGRNPAASIPDHVLDRASQDRCVVLIVGPQDEPRYRETTADRAVARLQRRGRSIDERFSPGVDHSVLSRTARNELAGHLDELFAHWKAQ